MPHRHRRRETKVRARGRTQPEPVTVNRASADCTRGAYYEEWPIIVLNVLMVASFQLIEIHRLLPVNPMGRICPEAQAGL
jgi:hypothetical protein